MYSISSEEITEWAAYYHLDPFGGSRGDMQAALVAYWTVRMQAKKGGDMKLSDFLLKFGEAHSQGKDMTQQEILNHIRARFPGHG